MPALTEASAKLVAGTWANKTQLLPPFALRSTL
jgi:hypothetical protein